MTKGGLLLAIVMTAQMAYAASENAYERLLRDAIERGTRQVEKAFHRRQATVETSNGSRLAAPGQWEALFPQYGFAPLTRFVTFSLSALDQDKTRVCAHVPVRSHEEWRAAVRGLGDSGYGLSDAACEQPRAVTAPSEYPAQVHGRRTLDTQDVVARSVFPPDLQLSLAAAPLTRPSLTLQAPAGQWGVAQSFTVTNTTETPMGIVGIDVRSGFEAAHNCEMVLPLASCTVSVRYQGSSAERHRVGSLLLSFSTGSYARVGLLGVRQP